MQEDVCDWLRVRHGFKEVSMPEEWKLKGYKMDQYPKVDPNEINFPKEIYIAYAVCGKRCGRTDFIVDGGNQCCDYCGKSMFRTEVRKYILADTK